MDPTVQAAWIAFAGAASGIGGAVLVAIAGYRYSRKATITAIEAAHNEKVWDQRSALYVELVAAVMDRQERRKFDLHVDQTTVGEYDEKQAELNSAKEPDWRQLQARAVSFTSRSVINALHMDSSSHAVAVKAIAYFRRCRARADAHAYDSERDGARADERSAFESAKEVEATAEKMDVDLIDLIRNELNAWGAGLPTGSANPS